MIAEERRARLLELIRLKGFASLPELAEALGVSESTVRRDLDALEETGAARRTHGGVLYSGPSPKVPHFEARQSMNWEKKRAIARRAAQLIEDGDTVLLDGGTTTYELARELSGRPLQVVTNSLPVANLFMAGDGVDLVFVGGYVHGRTGVTLGPYANDMLSRLNVRRAVLSVAGVNVQGFYNSNLLLVETERAMMRAADQVMVVADSTKFGRSSLALLCGLGDVHCVVADEQLDEAWRKRLESHGVQLVLAELSREEALAEGH
ncbi:MAG: DeoR family transcriptional regulator [Pirellulaceae bacterium]|nr:MAG: DeoR family transcriptional regulator [Pirellulaceae bacterium]